MGAREYISNLQPFWNLRLLRIVLGGGDLITGEQILLSLPPLRIDAIRGVKSSLSHYPLRGVN